MLFKLTIAAFALVAVTQAMDFNFMAGKETLKDCAKENNVKDIKKALLPGSKDPNAKCLKHCIALKMNFITENGEPILDKAPKNCNITEFIQTCAKQHTETDKCERVNQISMCVKDKSEQLMEAFSDECAKETNTEVTSYKDLAKNPLGNAFNKKLYCYYRCMLMKTKAMDADANVDIDKVKPFLAGSKYEKIIDQVKSCSKANNQKDICTKAAQRVICVGQKYVMGSFLG